MFFKKRIYLLLNFSLLNELSNVVFIEHFTGSICVVSIIIRTCGVLPLRIVLDYVCPSWMIRHVSADIVDLSSYNNPAVAICVMSFDFILADLSGSFHLSDRIPKNFYIYYIDT